MSTKTTYSSTVSVPVYASWKCECCGEVNFSTGAISYKSQETTTSFRNSKHEEAKNKASRTAQLQWKDNAYQIIKAPNENAQAMRSGFYLQSTRCTKCGKKPKWDKDMKYIWCVFAMIPAIISGICVIAEPASIGAWLFFLAFAGVMALGILSESRYKKMMKKLPREITPVIGSLNPELVEYANQRGTVVPTPDESIAIVKAFGAKTPLTAASHRDEANYSTPHRRDSFTEDDQKGTVLFCRKCGTKLCPDSRFCHKCGNKNAW